MRNTVVSAVVAGILLIGGVPVVGQTTTDGEHTEHHPEGDKPAETKPAPNPQTGPAMQPGTGGMGMMGPMVGMMGGGGMMAPHEHVEGRLAFLKAELAITAAQESAWSAFAAAARKASKEMGMGMGTMPGAPTGGWLGMLDRQEKMMTSRLASLRALKAPAMALYAALTDDQKKIADKLMIGPMGPMGPM